MYAKARTMFNGETLVELQLVLVTKLWDANITIIMQHCTRG